MEAVIKAILEQSAVDLENGEKAGLVGAADVCFAMTDIMAGFIASSPDCQTPADARQLADGWRKMFHARLKAYMASDGPKLPILAGTLN